MAIQTQLPEFHVTGADLPFTNFGPIDIPSDRGVVLDPANDYGIQLPTTNGTVQGGIGFVMETVRVGATGRVRTLGTKRAIADGAINRGDDLSLSSAPSKEGFVRVATGTGTEIVGKALTSAADLDPISVLVIHAKNA